MLPDMVSTDDGIPFGKLKMARRKVVDACHVAAAGGATVVALGGFTSIAVCGEEQEISVRTGVAVTSGNTYTSVLATQGVCRALDWAGLALADMHVAVVGASGDIGSSVCQQLAGRVGSLVLAARNVPRLKRFAGTLPGRVEVATDAAAAAACADVIVTAASGVGPVLAAAAVRPGAFVCDVGYPKNTGAELAGRHDVFAFFGGLASPPVAVDFGYDSGLPARQVLYGCFSEGILLALDGRAENFSAGRGGIDDAARQTIAEAAVRHGFGPVPLYGPRGLLTEDDARRVAAARAARAG
jgi:predicted amino acid dehydrogenase